jgi:hypothetical protein
MTILNIETVNRFRTADGQEFDNKLEAQRHATVISVTEKATSFVTKELGYTKSHLTGAVKAIVEWELNSRFGVDEAPEETASAISEQKYAA